MLKLLQACKILWPVMCPLECKLCVLCTASVTNVLWQNTVAGPPVNFYPADLLATLKILDQLLLRFGYHL